MAMVKMYRHLLIWRISFNRLKIQILYLQMTISQLTLWSIFREEVNSLVEGFAASPSEVVEPVVESICETRSCF